MRQVATRVSPRETGVSAREAEVLAAVGEHLTNAEIGARLFISIRTVESHVSSLLRKLQVNDRRALVVIAANLAPARAGGSPAPVTVGGVLPTPLTPFVGRSVERAELSATLRENRLVTALGPVQLARGDVRAAAASAMRRLEILAPLQITATTGFEFFDGYVMAVECAVAAGDLAAARGLAERLHDLPFYREEAHAATARLLPVTLLSGDWSEAIALADRFRVGWERAGRPRVGNLSRGAYAAATVYGLRGDEAARVAWLDIVRDLQTPGLRPSVVHFTEFFDAMLLLHRGHADQAERLMSTPPEEFDEWFSGLWRPWYAALWVRGRSPQRIRRSR